MAALLAGALAAGGMQALAATAPAAAAVSCTVTYSVVGQWSGGFQGSVRVTNTGDPVSGWRLGFSFPDGQTVAQGWGGDWTTGGTPSVSAPAWNSTLGTGASAEVGFIGTSNGSNGPATNFTLNGTACAGDGGTPASTSSSSTSSSSSTTSTTSAAPTTTTTHTTTTRPTTTSRTTTTSNGGGGATLLVQGSSGRCLDVWAASTDAGAPVQIYDCNGVQGQQWEFRSSGELRTNGGAMCLDAEGWGTTPGSTLITWTCHGGSNQRFVRGSNDSIVNPGSGLCVDTQNGGTGNTTRTVLQTCNGSAGQRWTATTSVPTTSTTTTRPTTTTRTTTTTAGTPPASYPYPGRITGDTGAHDPTVVRRPDGSYLVATTGRGIPLKVSNDRIDFRDVGSAFPNGTSWTSSFTTGDLWAPDLSYHNGQYYLYYSASTFGSQNSAIFLATSPSGNPGTWTNRGIVIRSSGSVNYNAIDPDLIVDQQGNWWLSFGSFWSGIKLIALDRSTGLRSGNSLYSLATRPSSASGAVEAPDIIHRGGYYYLFVSFDRCCQGANSNYRLMVGRSTSITGPYVDRRGVALTNGGGTQILAGHGSIHGPGHSAILRDVDGEVLFYHYYADWGAPYLGINLIGWDGAGWPYVY